MFFYIDSIHLFIHQKSHPLTDSYFFLKYDFKNDFLIGTRFFRLLPYKV
jgi:hypothetical protein